MKVLHVIPSVSKLKGGPSSAVLDMVRALRQHQVDARIATTNDDGPHTLSVPLKTWVEYEGVPVIFFPRFNPPVGAIQAFGLSLSLTRWLNQHLADFDVVHVHAVFCFPSTVAMALARRKGIPYLTTAHGLLCEWSLQQSARRKRLYLNLLERANLNVSRAIHFNSEKEQRDSAAVGLKTPGIMIPHGISIPPAIPDARERLCQKLKLASDKLIVLFLSRLHPIKRLDLLIPALAKLPHESFQFLLAGSGAPAYTLDVDTLLAEYHIQQCTQRLGFVQGEERDLLLQGADLFVQTSQLESFGMAVLEALASGTPALVTPGVALADVIQAQQLGWVAAPDSFAIAERLNYLLDHRQEMAVAGQRAQSFVRNHYTWEHIAPELIRVYGSIQTKGSL